MTRGVLVAMALWGAFGCGGGADCEECDGIQRQIEREAADPGSSEGELAPGQAPCGPFDDPSLDVPYYAVACDELRDCLGEVDACSESDDDGGFGI